MKKKNTSLELKLMISLFVIVIAGCFPAFAAPQAYEETSAGILPVLSEDQQLPHVASPLALGAEKVLSTDCDIEINFDETTVSNAFANLTRLTDAYASQGIHFEGPGGNDGGAVINSSGWTITGHSAPNFLGFNTGAVLSDGGKPIGPETIHFDEPIVFFEAAFGAGAGGTLTLKAYDTAGYAVNTKTATLTAAVQRVRVMGQHISRVEFSCTANSWIMDDICIIKNGDAGVLHLFLSCENGGITSQDFATPALANLGYNEITQITNRNEFEFAIRTGDWDLIILDNYNVYLDDTIYDALHSYYSNGGRILFYSYELLPHAAHSLVADMGVTVDSSYSTPEPVYVWIPDSLFNVPNFVPDLELFQDICMTDGERITINSATAVAGYATSEQAGEVAVAISPSERIILNAFTPGLVDQDADSDGKNDMIELYENEIYFLTGTGDQSLSATPTTLEFALPLEGAETQQVTLENPSDAAIDWISGVGRVLLLFADVPGNFLKELRREPGIGQVDYLNVRYETPALDTLLDYDVVIVGSNFAFLDANALGDALADYVDEGGKVIHASSSLYVGYAIAGRFVSGGYAAFSVATDTDFNDRNLGAYEAHPIMEGISTLQNYFGFPTTLTYGATLIASWDSGAPMVAVKGDNIVGINLFVLGLYPQYEGDVAHLFRNAILWLQGESPLSIDPASGTLLPGATATVNVTADAAGLPLDFVDQYLVGFRGLNGGEATVETSFVVTSTCMDDATFSQRPAMPSEGMWGASTSSVDSPHTCYENFSGLTEPVAALRWWGVDAAWSPGWTECDRAEPDTFAVRFFTDNAGLPDTLVKELSVQPTVTNTGLTAVGFYEVKEYEAVLPEKVFINEGWIAIMGAGTDTCWFLWMYSHAGDGTALQDSGSGPFSLGIDLSLCIVTDPECLPIADVSCDTATPGDTTGNIAFNDVYPCAGWDASGPEAVYRFIPSEDGQVELSLTDTSVDLDLYLLETTCLPGQCVAYGGDALSYTVSAGVEYFVVIDGADAGGGSFTLHVECPQPEGEGEGEIEGETEGETEGEPPAPDSLEEAAQALLDAFDDADTDTSGGLSEAEAMAALPGLTHEQFVSLDINGDGEIIQDELNQFLDTSSGCCAQGCQGCGSDADKMEQFRRFLGDYLLVGLSIVGVLLLGGTRRKI